ncbi:hypothetical protein B0H14DRAFT_2610450 [Mycena olivaceomarginata]|nr:hypothetical protein B0H14DRAFT_2610450 [Mycena olivaceomarginata]
MTRGGDSVLGAFRTVKSKVSGKLRQAPGRRGHGGRRKAVETPIKSFINDQRNFEGTFFVREILPAKWWERILRVRLHLGRTRLSWSQKAYEIKDYDVRILCDPSLLFPADTPTGHYHDLPGPQFQLPCPKDTVDVGDEAQYLEKHGIGLITRPRAAARRTRLSASSRASEVLATLHVVLGVSASRPLGLTLLDVSTPMSREQRIHRAVAVAVARRRATACCILEARALGSRRVRLGKSHI